MLSFGAVIMANLPSGATGGSALNVTKNNRDRSPEDLERRSVGWSGASAPDTAAKWHIILSTAFLAVAGIVWLVAMVELRFPGTLTGPFSYGRIRPVALLLTVIGWLTLSLIGGVYYILPRLTGTRMRREELAVVGGAATAAVTLAGALAVLLGAGDGTGPFSLPWWISLPLAATLAVPMVVTVATVRRRREPNIYVSLWYAMAGVVWLPLLYLAGAIPLPTGVGAAVSESVSLFGLANLWVMGMGIGLSYYVLVKETGNPLASRQLARVGFWSLAFASAWSGVAPLVFGPIPGWLEAVAFLMTLALPVSALANTANLALTTDTKWAERSERPVVAAALSGAFFVLLVAALTVFGTVRSASAVVGLTPYWDGVLYAALFGAGGLLVAAWSYQALPSITGRRMVNLRFATVHLRATFWGVGLTAALLVMAGLVSGYSWSGGSFTGVGPTGEGWESLGGMASLLVGLSVISGLVALAGQLSFCLAVLRTFTSGRAVSQEILAPADETSPDAGDPDEGAAMREGDDE